MTLELTPEQRAAAEGELGEGIRRAMLLVTGLASATNSDRLIAITRAHVDAALYHGPSGLDFVRWLLQADARVAVPTTLNVAALDLLRPATYRGDAAFAAAARELVESYVRLGCSATLTCAPYQAEDRPRFGEQVAWAESNAIAFVNSVLGARTARYGDFIDVAAAITGWVPLAGLHILENRRASVVITLDPPAAARLSDTAHFGALGLLVGSIAGTKVPAIVGMPETTTEDDLKALGAAAASSGAVAMFHAVGITPEAPTLETCLANGAAIRAVTLDWSDVQGAMSRLATAPDGLIDAVCLGTPHFSLAEFARLRAVVAADSTPLRTECIVTTSRAILSTIAAVGLDRELEAAGIQILTDTCSYVTQVLRHPLGTVMTNSAKWAHYAPANLGSGVVYGSLAECVASARAGSVVRFDG